MRCAVDYDRLLDWSTHGPIMASIDVQVDGAATSRAKILDSLRGPALNRLAELSRVLTTAALVIQAFGIGELEPQS